MGEKGRVKSNTPNLEGKKFNELYRRVYLLSPPLPLSPSKHIFVEKVNLLG
jgi:hypothetical protein